MIGVPIAFMPVRHKTAPSRTAACFPRRGYRPREAHATLRRVVRVSSQGPLSEQLRLALVLASILAVAALVQGASYWPGIMTWDAITQYDQAVEGAFDDWHPPVMAWLWRQLIAVHAGPAPMFLLQIALYWSGYGLIVAAALRRRQPIAAMLVTACALMPFPVAIMGSVLKDCLMQGCFLVGVGLFAWSRPGRDWPYRIAAIAFLLMGALLRFNAFMAVVPLLVWILPAYWRSAPWRVAASTAALGALVLLAMPTANRLVGAETSHVELSLMIFDLGGITRHSGTDMFPPIGVADPVAVNARCYRPDRWDSYSSWGDPPCPINFDRVEAAMERSGSRPFATLARAALAHPLAYAEHRLTHFNLNTRFLVHDEVQGPVPDRAVDNDWHFTVKRGPGLKLINQLTGWSIHSPLGWPIWWIALAAGLLVLSPALPSRSLVPPLSLSALFYGLGYLPFSVSSELRYHLWTITCAAIAASFACSDFFTSARVSRGRLMASLAPAIAVGLLCALWRLS